MNNAGELRVNADGSAGTVFLQRCEPDSQWTVKMCLYASEAGGSVLAPTGWARVLLPDPAGAAATALTLQAKPGAIRYTDSFIQSMRCLLFPT